ncbi:MAG: aminopeptidase P N-terminal domain-containing protein [Legionella sp.]
MISKRDYQQRRLALAAQLPVGSIAFIPAASLSLRNGDAHYRFRQDSDFYYLTGYDEPDALLAIEGGMAAKSYLFNLPRDPVQEQWTGERIGQQGACERLGVDGAYSLTDLDKYLVELLADRQAIYYVIGRYPVWEKRYMNAWHQLHKQSRRGINAADAFCNLEPILSEMRLFKSDEEILFMKKAALTTIAAHRRAMRTCHRVDYEYQLEAEIIHELTLSGCRNMAYDPIIASGANACVLHYTANNQPLVDGDLILIDAGGEYCNYAADVTRTYPRNGRFTAEQRLIYDLVLSAQQAAIAMIRPGLPWDCLQATIVNILTAGLLDLGLLSGHVNELIATEAYKPFYMHQSGHWLGLDVHDCGRYKIDGQWRSLQEGMVLTVEPGLYIKPQMPGVDPRWWGIGVRIEDDIQVIPGGYHNLTADLATDIPTLEELVRG